MLYRYIKRTSILFIIIFSMLFMFKAYTKTEHFRKNSIIVLNSLLEMNLTYDEVYLENLNKVIVKNIKINTLDGEEAIKANEGIIKLNLLMPTRIPEIFVKGGNVLVERNDKDINLDKITKSSNSVRRHSNLGKISFEDVNIKYIDISYRDRIEKDLINAKGIFKSSKIYDVYLEAGAESNLDEKIGINIELKRHKKESLLDIFSLKDYKLSKNTDDVISFKFNNIKAKKEYLQYAEDVYNLIDVESGILNGNLRLEIPYLKEIEIYGKLNIDDANLKYVDYKDKIENANATINFDRYNIKIKSNNLVKDKKMDLTIDTNISDKTLNLALKFDDFDYETLKKYKLFEDLNIELKSNNISLDIRLGLDLAHKKPIFNKFEGFIKTPKLNIFDLDIDDVNARFDIVENNILKIELDKVNIKKDISYIKLDEDIIIDLLVNLNDNKLNANFSISNNSDFIDIKKIKGNLEFLENKDLNITFVEDRFNLSAYFMNKENMIKLNSNTKKDINVKYSKNDFVIRSNFKDMIFDIKSKEIVKGNLDIFVKAFKNKYFDFANLNIKVDDKYNINSDIFINDSIININGNTTKKDYKHSYILKSDKIDLLNFIEKLNILSKKDIKEHNINVNMNVNLEGERDKIKGNFSINSNNGGYLVEYENLDIKGRINDLIDLDIDIHLKMEELWFMYQRFVDVISNIKVKKDEVIIENFGNDKLNIEANYSISNEELKLDGNINSYDVYSTNDLDALIRLNNLNFSLYGPINNLKGYLTLDDSPLLLKNKEIGKVRLISDILDNKINIDTLKLRNYNLSGIYDIKNENYDINLKIVEDDIKDIVDLEDLKLNVKSDLSLKGNIKDSDIKLKLEIIDLRYKNYKIPKIYIDALHSKVDLFNLLNTGLIDIKAFEIRDYEDNVIFKGENKYDLANLNINFNVENKEVDLSKLNIFKDSKYNGLVNLNAKLIKNKEENFASISINGNDLTLEGFNFNEVNLDIQASNKDLHLSQVYLEYEKNPLLIDGHLQYDFSDYDLRLVADDFKLKILELNPYITKADGKANLDLNLKKGKFEGNIKIDDLIFQNKNKNIDISKFYTDLLLDNKLIEINRFNGNLNGGFVEIKGNLELPEIPNNFIETKNIILKPINLDINLNKVNVNYEKNNVILTSNTSIKNNKITSENYIEKGRITNIPSKSIKKENGNRLDKMSAYFENVKNEIFKNLLKQYIVDISLKTNKDVNLDIHSIMGVVKDVKGEGNLNARINIEENTSNIIADLSLINSSFVINGNRFIVEEAIVKFNGDTDPYITFKAVSNIKGEEIILVINGLLSEKKIEFKSSSGKSNEAILSLLAFNEENSLFNIERLKASNLVGTALETTLNNLLFSSITNTITSVLGIERFNIKANFDYKNNKGIEDILSNTSTTFSINNKLIKKPEIYWNAELTLPLRWYSDNYRKHIKYNLWLNYNIQKGISATAGIKSPIIPNENGANVMFYTGLQYENKYNNFEEILEDLMNLFKRKEKLKK